MIGILDNIKIIMCICMIKTNPLQEGRWNAGDNFFRNFQLSMVLKIYSPACWPLEGGASRTV